MTQRYWLGCADLDRENIVRIWSWILIRFRIWRKSVGAIDLWEGMRVFENWWWWEIFLKIGRGGWLVKRRRM